ncbi:MAG: gamma-glutamylcyclotransferase [Gammaproteobacteria bacterium]|nr:MAG: gamma-glutamylcyclotransferase [Gammaproteobacteria bacterium]
MERLFSYGTLQMDKVQQELFGRKLDGVEDILMGFVISDIRIKDKEVIKTSGTDIHPILRYTGNNSDEVAGIVFEISTTELHQADKYEVKDYMRKMVKFKSGNQGWAYVKACQR